ncbi:TetR family transcriptional regulator [Streptomyces sp. NPDC001795]|uniref:acyl-CoA-like ligand-binding transcription factor n=1 Tax=Streptomyces sp. NPDC001795 TaxID=3154525 RepID=UPI00332EC32D
MAPLGKDLRERRRRETQREIHAAVVRLARTHGFEKVTVEMISAEAGISQRTFFNYFPSKESAAVGQAPGELPPDLVARFVAGGPPAHPRDVLADLTRLLVDHLAEDPPERQDTHDIFELAHSTPVVLAALMARFDAFRQSLAETVARRMGPDVDEEIPDLIASVAMAAVRNGMERWSQDTADDRADSPVPYVERSVALLSTLLAPEHP